MSPVLEKIIHNPLIKELEKDDEFKELREDVKKYFGRYMEKIKKVSLYKEKTRWKHYERHKKALSKVCGFDAENGKFNREEFVKSITYLVKILRI